MVMTLLDAVTATGAGSVQELSEAVRRGRSTGICQCVHTGTATTELQGSLNNSNWFTVATFSASGAYAVDLPLYVRGNCTARSSGAITLLLEQAG
jgi:hypothetical protein